MLYIYFFFNWCEPYLFESVHIHYLINKILVSLWTEEIWTANNEDSKTAFFYPSLSLSL